MSDLPGYDAWKLQTPPDWDEDGGVCPECDCYFDEEGDCRCTVPEPKEEEPKP